MPKAVFTFTVEDGRISQIAFDDDAERLRELDIVFLRTGGKERR